MTEYFLTLNRSDLFQLSAEIFMVRELLGDKRPEGAGMVELAKVAEFMDDDVVGEATPFGKLRVAPEQGDFVAKVEVAGLGAASPTGSLVPDADFVVFKAVELIVIFQPLMDQPPG